MKEMTSLERFLTACEKGIPDRVPFWIMRQVGRYDPDFESMIKKYGFDGICKDAKKAAQLSLMPIKKLGFDAIIILSDILFPAEAMGLKLEWSREGPLFRNPIKGIDDVEKLKSPEVKKDLPYIPETVNILSKKVGRTTPIIGFCGGAFTIATYMTRESRFTSVENMRRMLYADPKTAHRLFRKINDVLIELIRAQIDAGAHAGMVFDSLAGTLTPKLYEEFALPYQERILREVKKHDVPAILYLTGCCGILDKMVKTGTDVIGIDSRIDIGEAKKRVGKSVALQGNLDPYTLLGPKKSIEVAVRDCIKKAAPNGGYIFNTGEGLIKGLTFESVAETAAAVKKYGKYPIKLDR
jgi:uroporphyrinogen decarboxylase